MSLCSGCLVVNTTYEKLPAGPYRGVLLLDGRQSQRVEPDDVAANFNLEDVQRGELPFNFELALDADSALIMTLLNGEERIELPPLHYERPLATARDSFTAYFPLNDSYLTGYHEEGVLEGYYVDESRGEAPYLIPFVARYGEGHRFTNNEIAPTADLSGRWAVNFGVDTDEPYQAIGEFEQRGNQLLGTFQTTTGDFRYLEGTVQGDRAYLSTFDGTHLFLFAAKLQPDGTLLGLFRSGNHYQVIWEGARDPNATLPDPELETSVLDPESSVEIGGLLPNGEQLRVAELPGRFKVVSLFGSWCPNCRDEAVFLDSLRTTLSATDVSFYGAAFERMLDTTRALAAIDRFGESLDLGYPLAWVGSSDKSEATAQLGFLDEVRSYPTILILDERNRVVYIHTGFAGPATSAYGEFTRAFAKTLQTLLDS